MASPTAGFWNDPGTQGASPATWVTTLHPLSWAVPPPSLQPGRMKEGLLELLMLQNAQMNQMLLSRLAVAVLNPQPDSQWPQIYLEDLQEECEAEGGMAIHEEGPLVFHHHYLPCPVPPLDPLSTWPVAFLSPPHQTHSENMSRAQHHPPAFEKRGLKAVPPPPPPSATGTVGADVPPSADYYDAESLS